MISFFLVAIEKNTTNFALMVKDFLFPFFFFCPYGNLARLFVLTIFADALDLATDVELLTLPT